MELLSTIVGKVIELTVEPIGRQLGYLIFYHRNVNRLKDEFQELQTKREAVQHLVDDARRNGEEIEAQVQDWFRKVDEIIERKEKLCVEESHAKIGCSYKSCLNLWLRRQLSREAKNMKLEVAKIMEKSNFDKVSFKEPPQSIDLSPTGVEGIESRISTMNDVRKALADSSVNMIGLCGLGGVGKTTLATKVAKKVKEESLFDMVVMVKVAQHPDLKEIQRQIAENVGMKFEVETESIRANDLYKRLKKEKKLLIVLDDLWERLDLDKVGIPFDFDGKKKNPLDDENDKHYTKILLTSRNEELLSNQMNCKRIIRVDVLSESEAWELFKEKAELQGNSNDSDLLTVAAKVAERCGQLPLPIVTVARALRKKEISEWRDALYRLKRPSRRNITGIKEVDSSLKLSYDYLDNQELQSIFLLSAILSHDPLVIDLLMYSMGLSLLPDIRSMEEARDGLDALINKLKASNMLLDSFSNDRFTMHDVIRDVALGIASEKQQALVVRDEKQYELPEKNVLEDRTRLCLDKCDITKLPKDLYCPRLEFFLLDSKDSNLRISDMFFKYMQELKVMNFINMHFSSLPSSLGLLEKVKTLCLHSCTLEDIAEVGNLKNLKVLSLANSVITRLPSEFGGLTSLQMLNLAHCSKLEVIPPKLLSSLKRLEVLNMENSFNKWEAEGSIKGNDNASLMELMHLPNLSSLDIHIPNASVLPNDLFSKNLLKRYKIFIGQDWDWLGQYETLKTLKLKLESSIHLEHGVQKLLKSVEDLYLDKLYGISNVLYDLDGGGFSNLKHLWIQNNDQIEYVVKSTGHVDSFPNLETLNLRNLNGLKKLCQGQIMARSFQKLRVINVTGCNQLEVLFLMSMVGLFGSLVEIDIERCESIKEIVVSANENTFQPNLTTDVIIFRQLRYLRLISLPTLADFFFEENATNDGDNQVFKSFFSNKVAFPKLEILEMFYVNIQYIWSNQLLHNSFSDLKRFIVKDCNFLVKLIPSHILKCLINLEELEVRSCSLLEVVFDFEELKGTNREIHSFLVAVPLKKLKLTRLPKLKHVWSNDPKGIVSFQSLRRVETEQIPNLEKLSLSGKYATMIWNGQLPTYHFRNVRVLELSELTDDTATFSYGLLKRFSNLEELELRYSSIQEIFSCTDDLGDDAGQIAPFKKLTFIKMRKLKHIWNERSQMDRFLQNLQSLRVSWCSDLINLGPSSVSLKNLTNLKVSECYGLLNLLTSSTARSLEQLTRLEITFCNQIEEIITKEGEDVEKEIVFRKLKHLELVRLPSLKSFCSHNYTVKFPLLNNNVFIYRCPNLQGIEMIKNEKLLEVTFNKTIILL